MVTRIVRSKGLHVSKLRALRDIARKLVAVRSYTWRVFGGVAGSSVSVFDVRTRVTRYFDNFGVPSNLRSSTALDCANAINTYREACKVSVKRKIFARTNDKTQQKHLFTLLKSGKWSEDKWLSRIMRKTYRHGRSKVKNHIVLSPRDYNWFSLNGDGWIAVLSLISRKRIAIPMASNQPISGTIRLIVAEDGVAVHHTIEAPEGRPCGNGIIGIDRGYTEVFVDSDGELHGDTLGSTLSKESDCLKTKYQNRNKILAIANKSSIAKRVRIEKNNLGRKKLKRRKYFHQKKVRNIVSLACHSVVDKARTIASEDLTSVIKSNKPLSANQKRRLSGWVKGKISKTLSVVSHRRCSSVVVVNAAYTSQICHHCKSFGQRNGDKFNCINCKAVYQADHNAAVNVLARIHDHEIDRWTPFNRVKSILLARSAQRSRLTLQESSCTSVASTDSELPFIELID